DGKLDAALERWEQQTLFPVLEKTPEADRNAGFTTMSGQPIARLYTPRDLADTDPLEDIGFPGQFPFTRG
ncbi:methylmalonyl-CoA mutase family protein, partial [Vibrio campbellii]|uniref:methylmalonyl-CoA mutase family protein n=1 Tax=Vibrio campbellii TaxID=680 RepID=UPI000AFD4936